MSKTVSHSISPSLSFYLTLCLFLCLSLSLYHFPLQIYLAISISPFPSLCPSLTLSIPLSLCPYPYLCLSLCLSVSFPHSYNTCTKTHPETHAQKLERRRHTHRRMALSRPLDQLMRPEVPFDHTPHVLLPTDILQEHQKLQQLRVLGVGKPDRYRGRRVLIIGRESKAKMTLIRCK